MTQTANALTWYLARGEQQWGPITEIEMGHLVSMGKVLPGDLVWNQAMTGWVAASTIPGMVRAPMPPPQPPPRPPQAFEQPAFQAAPAAQHYAAAAHAAVYPEPSQPQAIAHYGAHVEQGGAVAAKPTDAATSTTLAMAGYILGFLGVIPILPIVGIVIAFVNLNTKPDWLATHYRWQVRTFGIGLLYCVIGIVTLYFVIGAFVLLGTAIWFIVRYVKGISALNRREPVENVERWGF